MLKYSKKDVTYFLTLKDQTKKKFLCRKQDIPRVFARYGVPESDLHDPSNVLECLKERI